MNHDQSQSLMQRALMVCKLVIQYYDIIIFFYNSCYHCALYPAYSEDIISVLFLFHCDIINAGKDLAEVVQKNQKSATITYSLKRDEQIHGGGGTSGKFSVKYDVERALDAGDLHVIDGFFVHAIAPEGLPPMPKNVLFTLDVSGSMAGDKIKQVKDAMWSICGDLMEGDQFNIMTFNVSIDMMAKELLTVTPANIRRAKNYVNSMVADGCKY